MSINHVILNSPSTAWLIRRIIDHRKQCKKWQKGDFCYDCHKGILTQIEREHEDLTHIAGSG